MVAKGVEQRIRTTTYCSPENLQSVKKQYPDIGSGVGVSPANKLPWEHRDHVQNIPIGPVSTFTHTDGRQVQVQLPEKPLKPLGNNPIGDLTEEPITEIDPGQGAGTAPNPPTGQYPPNPTPMQGAGDMQAGAPMPKLQVQGDPHETYGSPTPHDSTDTTFLSGGNPQVDSAQQFSQVPSAQDNMAMKPGAEPDTPEPLGVIPSSDSVTQPGMDRTAVGDKRNYSDTITYYLSLRDREIELIRRFSRQLLASPTFTWHDFLVKHPAGVDHYHGRRGRAYSSRTGMRVPEERHVVDARPRAGEYGGYAGLDEEKHLQGQHDQITHGAGGKAINEYDSELTGRGYEAVGWSASSMQGAAHQHHYFHPSGHRIEVHTDLHGKIMGTTEGGKDPAESYTRDTSGRVTPGGALAGLGAIGAMAGGVALAGMGRQAPAPAPTTGQTQDTQVWSQIDKPEPTATEPEIDPETGKPRKKPKKPHPEHPDKPEKDKEIKALRSHFLKHPATVDHSHDPRGLHGMKGGNATLHTQLASQGYSYSHTSGDPDPQNPSYQRANKPGDYLSYRNQAGQEVRMVLTTPADQTWEHSQSTYNPSTGNWVTQSRMRRPADEYELQAVP